MTWQDWLRTDQAWPVIQKAALSVGYKIRNAGIEKLLIDYGDLPDDISTALWIYIFEHAAEWENRKPLRNCIKAGERYIVNFIALSFFNHLRDKIRAESVSPLKYLYSRLRSALSSDLKILVHSCGPGVYYCCDLSLPFSPEYIYLGGSAPYLGKQFPGDVSLKNLHEKATIIRVAEYFWGLVTERGSKPVWVPVKDLAEYIASFLDVPAAIQFDDSNDRMETLRDNNWEQDYNETERRLMRAMFLNLAECCANRLTDKEKETMVRLFHKGQSITEAAEEMGYAGPSGVVYIRERALEKIRDCCITQPGLSPPDLDSEMFNDFMRTLLDLCKKSLENRNI